MTASLFVKFLALAASADQIFIRPFYVPTALCRDENDTQLAPRTVFSGEWGVGLAARQALGRSSGFGIAYEKAKRYDTKRLTPQVGRCPICYWRRV